MKRLTALLLALLLVPALAACSDSEEADGENGGQGVLSAGELPDSVSGLAALARLPANRAVERIPEFNGVGSGGSLLAVKNYYDEIGWVEVNQIEALERMDHTAEGAYFLLVPRYAGSRITVEAVDSGELLYQRAETPDDYALVVNSQMPEQPEMRVTVECEAGSASFQFTEMHGLEQEDLPLVADGVYYTEPGRTADPGQMERQTGGVAAGLLTSGPAPGQGGGEQELVFAVQLPEDCALGEGDGVTHSLHWQGYELTLACYQAGAEDTGLGVYWGATHESIAVDPERGLAKTDPREDVQAYAFPCGEWVVVIRAPWTVPELDAQWDAFALALASSFVLVE